MSSTETSKSVLVSTDGVTKGIFSGPANRYLVCGSSCQSENRLETLKPGPHYPAHVATTGLEASNSAQREKMMSNWWQQGKSDACRVDTKQQTYNRVDKSKAHKRCPYDHEYLLHISSIKQGHQAKKKQRKNETKKTKKTKQKERKTKTGRQRSFSNGPKKKKFAHNLSSQVSSSPSNRAGSK